MAATIEVRFESHSGYALHGRLHLPDGAPRAYALLAHCFTCGKDLRISTRMARTLTKAGYAVLRFDFTGLGDSEGEFADTTFSSNVDDLVAASEFLAQSHRAPDLLIGHSLGGAAVLAAAPRIDGVRAVVTIGAPAQPAHVRTLVEAGTTALDDAGAEPLPPDVLPVSVGGRPFRIKRAFLDDLETHDGAERARNLGAALLVMHSPQDEIVSIDNAQAIYRAARHPKSFVSLDGADHLLSTPGDAEYAASMLVAWAARYLPVLERVDAEAPAGEPGTVIVRIGPTGLSVDATVGTHHLRLDEPVKLGGTDTGPTPYDALLTALGACTAMTLRMYASRKQWPLEGVRVELSHGRVHAKDCADCASTEGRVDVIERRIELSGPLDGEQRDGLLAIADRCPVHRTLTSEIVIRSALLPASD